MLKEKSQWAPHDCPNCGEAAYVGGPGMPAECTSRLCPFYSEDCWVKHVMSLPDPGDPEPELFEDEDTQPMLKLPKGFSQGWFTLDDDD